MDIFKYPLVWPSLSEELAPFMKYFQGIVLNAGSGSRSVQLGQKDLNIDIVPENNPDIVADLHRIPLLDESVDALVSIAVLEHTRYAWIVVGEFYRVMRSGGYGVIAVPFLQPRHACPYDFVRFTGNGLVELMEYAGFEIVETRTAHHFGQTLAWLLWEYLQANVPQKITWPFWYSLLRQLSLGRILGKNSPNTNNTEYVIVRKPGVEKPAPAHYLEASARLDSSEWFFPLLACPRTRQPLHRAGDVFISADNRFTYGYQDGRLHILPCEGEFRLRVNDSDTFTLYDKAPLLSIPNPRPLEISSFPKTGTSDSVVGEGHSVFFQSEVQKTLSQSASEKVAVLATSEYEGIFKNGGVGTYYRNLAKKLFKQGWSVILILCDHEKMLIDPSNYPELQNIFLTSEIRSSLELPSNHLSLLSPVRGNWYDYQSYCCFFFVQAIFNQFPNSKVYVEFPEMSGLGYRTIQAKRAGCLMDNCQIGVTMHSGHEWVHEANEKYTHVRSNLENLWVVYNFEQISFEEADLAFFPSYTLKSKVETYGWRNNNATHLPNYVPMI